MKICEAAALFLLNRKPFENALGKKKELYVALWRCKATKYDGIIDRKMVY